MTEKFTPYPWKNKSESATTPLDRQELNKSEEEQGKYSEKGLIKSEEANAKSAVAEVKATEAKAEAKVAKEKAEAAETEAKAAKTEAVTAKSEISGTKAEAKVAKEKAEAAETEAKAAKTEAKSAQTTAESAKAQAEAAVIIAGEAGSSLSAGNPGAFSGTIKSPYKVIEKVKNLPTSVAITGAELTSPLLKAKTKIAKTPTEVKAGEWTVELELEQTQLTKTHTGAGFEVRKTSTKRGIIEVTGATVTDNTAQETTRVQITSEFVDWNHFYNLAGERKGITSAEAAEGVDAAPIIQEALEKAQTSNGGAAFGGGPKAAVACGEPGVYPLASTRISKNSNPYPKMKSPYNGSTFKACIHQPKGVTIEHPSRNSNVIGLQVTNAVLNPAEEAAIASPTAERPCAIGTEAFDEHECPVLGHFILSTQGSMNQSYLQSHTIPPLMDGILIGSSGIYDGTQINGSFRYSTVIGANHMQWRSMSILSGWSHVGIVDWISANSVTGNWETFSCQMEGGFCTFFIDEGVSLHSLRIHGGFWGFSVKGPIMYKPKVGKDSVMMRGVHWIEVQFEGGQGPFIYNTDGEATVENIKVENCQVIGVDSTMATMRPIDISILPSTFIYCGNLLETETIGSLIPLAGWGNEASGIQVTKKAWGNNLGEVANVAKTGAKRGIPTIRGGTQFNNFGEYGEEGEKILAPVVFPIANTEVREGQVVQDAAAIEPDTGLIATEPYVGGSFGGVALASTKAGNSAMVTRGNKTRPSAVPCKVMRLGHGSNEAGTFPPPPREGKTKLTATLENGVSTKTTESVKPSSNPNKVKVESTASFPKVGTFRLGPNIATYTGTGSTEFTGVTWKTLVGTETYLSGTVIGQGEEHSLPIVLFQSNAYIGAVYLSTLSDLPFSGTVSSIPSKVITYRQTIAKGTTTKFKVILTAGKTEATGLKVGGESSIKGLAPAMLVTGSGVLPSTVIESVDGANWIIHLSQPATASGEKELEVTAPCAILEGTLFNDSTRTTETFKLNALSTVKVESTLGWPLSGSACVATELGEKTFTIEYTSKTETELKGCTTKSGSAEIPAQSIVTRFEEKTSKLGCRSRIYRTAQVESVVGTNTTYKGVELKLEPSVKKLTVVNGELLPVSGRALVYSETTFAVATVIKTGQTSLKVLSTTTFPKEGNITIGNTGIHFSYKNKNSTEFLEGEIGNVSLGKEHRIAGEVIKTNEPSEIYYSSRTEKELSGVELVTKVPKYNIAEGTLIVPVLVTATGGVFEASSVQYPYAGFLTTKEKHYIVGVVSPEGGGSVASTTEITDLSGLAIVGSNFPTEEASCNLLNELEEEATFRYKNFVSGNIESTEEPTEGESEEEVEGEEGVKVESVPAGFFVGLSEVEKTNPGVGLLASYIGGTTLTENVKLLSEPTNIKVLSTAGFPSKGTIKVGTESGKTSIAKYTGVYFNATTTSENVKLLTKPTSIKVVSTAGLPTKGSIKIGTDVARYSGVSGGKEFTGLVWTNLTGSGEYESGTAVEVAAFTGLVWILNAGSGEYPSGAAVVPKQGSFVKAGETVRAAYGASGRTSIGDIGVVYGGTEGPVVGTALENDIGGQVEVLF